MAAPLADAPPDAALGRATMQRVSARLLPFLFLLYIVNYLDRTNVGIAALRMNEDLHFSAGAFGLGAGIFFVGYALCEVPSNVLLVRLGARRWIARIMISWGLLASAMMFVHTPFEFYVLRFLLGIAEAGFFPGIVYYLSEWFPASQRARAGAGFMVAIPVSGTIGGPLGGWLLGFHGRLGFSGWQWLYLVEGIPAVVLGLVVLRVLSDRPETAAWLPAPQRAWLAGELARERAASGTRHDLSALSALGQPMVWLVSLPYFLALTAWYAFVFWAPTLIREALGTTPGQTGWISGAIAGASALAILVVGASSDRSGERCLHAAGCMTVCAAGLAMAALLPSPVGRVIGLALAQMGVIAFLSPFWVLPTLILGGTAAAVGIALVNALGSVGGFFGPNLVGVLKDRTGSASGALLVLSAMALGSAVLCAALRRHPALGRRGRRRLPGDG